jgi:hypothetical protein
VFVVGARRRVAVRSTYTDEGLTPRRAPSSR